MKNDQHHEKQNRRPVPEDHVPVEIAGKYTEGYYGPAGVEPGVTSTHHGSYAKAEHARKAAGPEQDGSRPPSRDETAGTRDTNALPATAESVGRYTEGEYGSTGSVAPGTTDDPPPHYTHTMPAPEKRHRG